MKQTRPIILCLIVCLSGGLGGVFAAGCAKPAPPKPDPNNPAEQPVKVTPEKQAALQAADEAAARRASSVPPRFSPPKK